MEASMKTDTFKMTIHMVSSLDGFIAKKDNSISWLDTADRYEDGVAEEDAGEFMKTIDCFVIGARTYEHALELSKDFGWPYGDVPTIVLSHRKLPVHRNNIQIYSCDLTTLVEEHLKSRYRNVWCVGGAMLVRDLIRQQLAGEIRISVIPVILGDGLPFFDHIGREQALHLKGITAYKSGIAELWYEIKKNTGPVQNK